MSFLNDIKAVLTPKDIIFKEIRKEDDEIYSFIFEASEPISWKAGQHAMFIVKHRKVEKSTKVFSIASSPLENKIMLTTKIGKQPSDYKKALLELKIGMKMTLRGPMGGFYLSPSKPACFITGGIGITPFRSMLKELAMSQKNFNSKITLLYINSTDNILFENELKTFGKQSNIQIDFFTDRDKLIEKVKYMSTDNKETTFFLAGSKQMTSSIKSILLEQDIKKKNIKVDTFFGY